ncbi:MAG: DUF4383 domain-containing protein [Actinomycetota bacterium]|nr:DUF4383 domain-containing protein [Actinomycetota bacterium]
MFKNSLRGSPAQIGAFAIGAWWTLNGLAAFVADAFGHFDGALNAWHALFHLLPGLLGLAVARRAQAAHTYLLGAGALYVMAAAWGLIAGNTALGLIAVDTLGNVVHLAEGLVALTVGLSVLRQPAPA